MYTFIILYPYALSFRKYITKTFHVVCSYDNVCLTHDQMKLLYSHGGYCKTLAKKKSRINTEGSKGYNVFLIRGTSLRQTLVKKRRLRNTICVCESVKVDPTRNMFHSLDTMKEKLYMMWYIYCHTKDYTLLIHFIAIICMQ